jgi:uncharacterized protein
VLIQFSVENFLSIKEKITLRLVASSDRNLKSNLIEIPENNKFKLLRSVGIYGANASGKSNVLKALQFMHQFIVNSAKSMKISDMGLVAFKLDQVWQAKPSHFELDFIYENTSYTYGFELDSQKIHKEWLYSYPKTQRRVLFERNANDSEPYKFGASWKGNKKQIIKFVRPDALFLSVAAQLNDPSAKPLVQWLKEKFIFNFSPLETDVLGDVIEDEKLRELIKTFLNLADFDVKDLNIKVVPFRESRQFLRLPPPLQQEMINTLGDLVGDSKVIDSITVIREGVDVNGVPINVSFDIDEESTGTKTFFFLANKILLSLMANRVLVIDQLGSHLHPLLTRYVVQIFNNQYKGLPSPLFSQLVFVTQDVNLLDLELLRREQILFTEKDRQGATTLHSYKPRKGESMRKGYLVGRYGAIPEFDDLEELLPLAIAE